MFNKLLTSQVELGPPSGSRRTVLRSLASASLACALSGGAWRGAYAQPRITMTPLRGGLSLIAGAGANVVLDTRGERVLLVDSGAAEHAEALAHAIVERAPAGPRILLNTHWHLEHTGGNETAAPQGSTIVAHENTRLWMSTKFYLEWEDRFYRPRSPAALPNKTFFSSDPQPLRIDNGNSSVEYAHLPEAHTDGDVYVRFPDVNVIVAGGILTTGRYPILDYITGGWIGGLADATQKLIDLADVDTLIVPDIGAPQRRADLMTQLTMLQAVRERIEAIALQGRGVEDMIAEKITREFDARYGNDSALFITNAYEGLWWNRLRGIVA